MHNKSFPKWVNYFVKVFIHPDYREEIIGDLLEKYNRAVYLHGKDNAKNKLYADLFSLIKINLFFNLNSTNMTIKKWAYLAMAALLLFLAGISPFLSGAANDLTHSLSRFSQIIGYLGLGFVPFGLVWLIIELRNKKDQVLNKWTNGFYPALLVLTPIFIFIPLQLLRAIASGNYLFELLPFFIIASIIGVLIYFIYKLKSKSQYKFNVVPAYIVFLPLIAILISNFVIENAAKNSREKVIQMTMPIINAVNQYKLENGTYPDNLELLKGKYLLEIPVPQIMGLRNFQYDKQANAYQISFEQMWHWSATEVVYYRSPNYRSKNYGYETYTTEFANWSYQMVD